MKTQIKFLIWKSFLKFLKLILIPLFFIACENSGELSKQVKVIDSKNKEPTLDINQKYKDSLELFSQIYLGMNYEDFETSIIEQTKSNQLYSLDSISEEGKLWLEGLLIDSETFKLNNIPKLNFFAISYTSGIYYPLFISSKTYYIEVLPQFNYNRLNALNLVGPNYYHYSTDSGLNTRRIEEKYPGQEEVIYNEAIRKLYSDKFESVAIFQKAIESKVDRAFSFEEYVYDRNIYILKSNDKVIKIYMRCCDFKTVVSYFDLKTYEAKEKLKRDNMESRKKYNDSLRLKNIKDI
tara:strand:- start:3486 stop:4367 length:882 start_codon:yes stop_codon:yes gene_type:complete